MAKYTFSKIFLFRSPVLLAAFAAALFLSGCSTKAPVQNARVGDDVYIAIDAPDETVEPYQPIDDGQPLTRAELAAFESTGELDKNLSQEEKQIVELHFKYFVHNNRKTVERFLKRSELYMPFVTQVFRERGLPEELSCLAFVESGFNPNAVSRAGAGGMWQFMPYTGKKFGLAQDRWLDERRDPYKATEAAAAYLTKLHGYFNDWHLAIASYNAGEGKIGRALAGTEAKTFFEICRKNDMLDDKAQLKEETQQYLPRFLAFVKILRNAEALGFVRPDPKGALDVAAVSVPAGVDLRRFAREIKVDWEQFKGLNPAYLRNISPPHKATNARVPAAREAEALAWLKQKDVALYAGWRDYRVRSGDSLGRIAHRTGSSTALLRQVNGKKNNSLRVGEYLLVPGSARAARSTMTKIAPDSAPKIARTRDGKPASGYSGVHKIASGDTLFALALQWGTSVDDICELNNIEPSSRLKIGQSVYIPSGKNMVLASAGPEEKTPEAKPAVSLVTRMRGVRGPGQYVVVQQGDTLSGIASANGCSVADICKANNITPKTRLQIGRELYIRPGTASAEAAKVPSPTSVTKAKKEKPVATASAKARGSIVVQSGDTLYSLARTHGTSVDALVKQNGISTRTPLKPGQVLHLP
ncbi:LysM peptidoglycan-binding domain-containing protein [Desulfovibrio sp. OttesenSCG-928-O18]|nr:LysM peptidoglycan-binding domain-containing protein [Desulfovibrio sp. OttesenSCG-928-O18]